MTNIVIVGGGQAGAALAAKLRDLGYGGDITLICGEDHLPYQRPPLSKKYLLGEMTREQLYLRPERFYQDHRISLRRGRAVTGIDTASHRVMLDQDAIPFDMLALTTGSSPRKLPTAIGGDLPAVYTIRGLSELEHMAFEFRPGRKLLIIGGGYIGLEAAAVASKIGLTVTLVESAPRILQRVASPETADYFRQLHTAHGVDIREGASLEMLRSGEDGVRASFMDGSICEADFAIVGIGVLPNTELAEAAGLECDTGIVVDSRGRTSDPAIWAAGDCTRLPYRDASIRLESVQNAIDQAEAVAANMMGHEQDYVPKPWFWSDQYDVKLQIAGLNTGYDHVAVRTGSTPAARSHWYYTGNELLAVDAMNEPRSYMVGKRLIEAGRSPLPEQVADPTLDLKSLL